MPVPDLHALWHDPAQLDRAVAGLVADGLLEQHPTGLTLPGMSPVVTSGGADTGRLTG